MNNLTYPQPQDNYFNQSTDSFSETLAEKEEVNFVTTSEIYDAVFQNAFHAMYIGTGNGQIVKFNEKICKIFGYSSNEMSELESADILEINEDVFINFLNQRNTKGIAKGEVTGIKKSGERFPCRISSVVYESDYGDKRSMNTLVDISNNLSARWNINE